MRGRILRKRVFRGTQKPITKLRHCRCSKRSGECECRAGVSYFTVHSLYSHPSEAAALAASAAAPFPNPPLRINSRESSGDRPTATPTFSSALGSSSLPPLRSVFSPVGLLSYSRSRRFNFLLTSASITPSFRQKIRQKSQDKNERMSRFQSLSKLPFCCSRYKIYRYC